MTLFIFIKYLHFVGIFFVVASLFAELSLVKPKVKPATLILLSKLDGLYGLGALITVGAGLTLWFGTGKPEEFYTANWIFLSKVALFTVVGSLSIWPTIFFVKNRKVSGESLIEIPKGIRISILVEVIILVVMPALAVLMANGVGGL